jgi:RHS repeat-associated protein
LVVDSRVNPWSAVGLTDDREHSASARSGGTSREPAGRVPQGCNGEAGHNPFLFTGRRLDSEWCGMQYRHRSYSTALGRFVSRDPAGYADGLLLYGYCGSQPKRAVDPTGAQDADLPEDPALPWGVSEDEDVWVETGGNLPREAYFSLKESFECIPGDLTTVLPGHMLGPGAQDKEVQVQGMLLAMLEDQRSEARFLQFWQQGTLTRQVVVDPQRHLWKCFRRYEELGEECFFQFGGPLAGSAGYGEEFAMYLGGCVALCTAPTMWILEAGMPPAMGICLGACLTGAGLDSVLEAGHYARAVADCHGWVNSWMALCLNDPGRFVPD